MSRFIVTGGCGFIGSHVAERLLAMGHAVVIVDDLSSGHEANIGHLRGDLVLCRERVEQFDFDSLDEIDGLFHLAAQASVPYSIEHFVESSTTNLVGALRVIDVATTRNIPLVYATSSAVYGNVPFGVETGAIELLSPYATDKYCMEMYAQTNQRLHGTRSFGLRFFNVYGPRQDADNPYSGVISVFVGRLLRGEPLTVNGGHQTRDFIYVRDVVDCVWRAYDYLLHNREARVANVLTGTRTSVNALVEHLAEIVRVKPVCVYQDLRAGDPESSNGSTEVMERLLHVNRASFVDIRHGLADTVRWMNPA
jgi:UDP-glucose 4-epimerase